MLRRVSWGRSDVEMDVHVAGVGVVDSVDGLGRAVYVLVWLLDEPVCNFSRAVRRQILQPVLVSRFLITTRGAIPRIKLCHLNLSRIISTLNARLERPLALMMQLAVMFMVSSRIVPASIQSRRHRIVYSTVSALHETVRLRCEEPRRDH